MTRLLITRHGNTFEPGETPRRAGARTDMPLATKGREQARALGLFLCANGMAPDAVYTGTLRRTIETAQEIIKAAGLERPMNRADFLNEIDYGPDENKTEDEVKARIGEAAVKAWDEEGTPPPGWLVDPAGIVLNWQAFAENIRRDHPDGTVLAVTSNGIARFAPCLTGDVDGFRRTHALKIATGALCVLCFEGHAWKIRDWNIRPPLEG